MHNIHKQHDFSLIKDEKTSISWDPLISITTVNEHNQIYKTAKNPLNGSEMFIYKGMTNNFLYAHLKNLYRILLHNFKQCTLLPVMNVLDI
jgi:hypothetical protein